MCPQLKLLAGQTKQVNTSTNADTTKQDSTWLPPPPPLLPQPTDPLLLPHNDPAAPIVSQLVATLKSPLGSMGVSATQNTSTAAPLTVNLPAGETTAAASSPTVRQQQTLFPFALSPSLSQQQQPSPSVAPLQQTLILLAAAAASQGQPPPPPMGSSILAVTKTEQPSTDPVEQQQQQHLLAMDSNAVLGVLPKSLPTKAIAKRVLTLLARNAVSLTQFCTHVLGMSSSLCLCVCVCVCWCFATYPID